MASERQNRANRANALKSTGPRSDAGKAQSAKNALVHGLTSAQVVLDWEDAAAFEALRGTLHTDYAPSDAISAELVEQLASLLWRLRRSQLYETAVITWITHQQAERLDDTGVQLGSVFLSANEQGISFRKQAGRASIPDSLADRRRMGRMLEAAIGEKDMFGRLARYERHLQRQIGGVISALAIRPRRRVMSD